MPVIILIACFLTAFATSALADESEDFLHEQLVHEQLLHEQLVLQQQLQQQLHEELAQVRQPEHTAEAPPPSYPAAADAPVPLTARQQESRPPRFVLQPVTPLADATPVIPPPERQVKQEAPAPAAPAPVAQQKPVAEAALPQPTGPLATRQGLDVGLQLSRYAYHEAAGPMPLMNNKGYKLGAEATYTEIMDDGEWFMRGEGRFAYGVVDYASNGTGSMQDNKDYTWELRGLAGKDIALNDFNSLTPYTGYGVRYLYNDSRGITDTGFTGYRRNSVYQYIPLGLTHRLKLMDNQSRLATTLEYDYFLVGHQRSIFGDIVPGAPTLKNTQRDADGGVKGSILFETGDWSVGPWFNYWHIGRSNLQCIPGNGCGWNEPENKTTEFGLKFVKKIF